MAGTHFPEGGQFDLAPDPGPMAFVGELFEWRGPSQYHYIRVPPDIADELRELSPLLTYGWGVIPVTVRIGESEFTTSLFPKDGGYLVPIKDKIRKMIEAEDASRPLSDSRIAELLGSDGLPLARRTVAKYREELRIPPSNLRKSVQ